MKKSFWKENGAKVLTGTLIAVFAILFYFLLSHLPSFGKYISKIASILAPILYGAVMAYLVSPVTSRIEDFLKLTMNRHKFPKKSETRKKIAKIVSVVLSFLLLLVIIGGFFWLVLSQVIPSVVQMAESFPDYVDKLVEFTQNVLKKNPELAKAVVSVWTNMEKTVMDFVKDTVLPNVQNYIGTLTNSVVQVFRVLYNMLVGFVVTIYLLSSRKTLAAQSIKLLYSSLPVKRASTILRVTRYADRIFGKFLTGKILDSTIIGLLCFIGLNILNMPYALLISVIVGVTNIIPFFGPFIGAVPSVFIILLISPLKALYLTIFIIVLQQIDGNIIGPKILGSSIGLSGFWIMFAILLFGGWWGVPGMIIGVPLFAVLYSLLQELVSRRLREKKLPQNTDFYRGVKELGPEDYSEEYGIISDEFDLHEADPYWEHPAYIGDEEKQETHKVKTQKVEKKKPIVFPFADLRKVLQKKATKQKKK